MKKSLILLILLVLVVCRVRRRIQQEPEYETQDQQYENDDQDEDDGRRDYRSEDEQDYDEQDYDEQEYEDQQEYDEQEYDEQDEEDVTHQQQSRRGKRHWAHQRKIIKNGGQQREDEKQDTKEPQNSTGENTVVPPQEPIKKEEVKQPQPAPPKPTKVQTGPRPEEIEPNPRKRALKQFVTKLKVFRRRFKNVLRFASLCVSPWIPGGPFVSFAIFQSLNYITMDALPRYVYKTARRTILHANEGQKRKRKALGLDYSDSQQ